MDLRRFPGPLSPCRILGSLTNSKMRLMKSMYSLSEASRLPLPRGASARTTRLPHRRYESFATFWRALLSMAMSVFGISSNGRLPAMDDNRRAQSLFAFATELHSRCKVLVNPIKRGRHQSGAVTTSACRKCAHRPRCQQRQRRATSTSFFWILCTIMKDIWPQRAGFIPQAAPKQ